jgi:hypothetical protein
MPERSYSTPDVVALTGLSYRQLDHWARRGILRPSVNRAGGTGTVRRYSERDVQRARSIAWLVAAGVNPGAFADRAIDDVVRMLEAAINQIGGGRNA